MHLSRQESEFLLIRFGSNSNRKYVLILECLFDPLPRNIETLMRLRMPARVGTCFACLCPRKPIARICFPVCCRPYGGEAPLGLFFWQEATAKSSTLCRCRGCLYRSRRRPQGPLARGEGRSELGLTCFVSWFGDQATQIML